MDVDRGAETDSLVEEIRGDKIDVHFGFEKGVSAKRPVGYFAIPTTFDSSVQNTAFKYDKLTEHRPWSRQQSQHLLPRSGWQSRSAERLTVEPAMYLLIVEIRNTS